MWIRSQNKEMLIEVKNSVMLNTYDNAEIDVNGETVASYSTNERAMEVMDEIQNAIFYDYNVGNKPVFEMPKE